MKHMTPYLRDNHFLLNKTLWKFQIHSDTDAFELTRKTIEFDFSVFLLLLPSFHCSTTFLLNSK